jgi:hypothetical protein
MGAISFRYDGGLIAPLITKGNRTVVKPGHSEEQQQRTDDRDAYDPNLEGWAAIWNQPDTHPSAKLQHSPTLLELASDDAAKVAFSVTSLTL